MDTAEKSNNLGTDSTLMYLISLITNLNLFFHSSFSRIIEAISESDSSSIETEEGFMKPIKLLQV